MNFLSQNQYSIKSIKSCPIMSLPDKQAYISRSNSKFEGSSQEFKGFTILQRVPTDESPFEYSLSEESGLGRSDSHRDDSEPEATLVVPPDGGWGWVVVAATFMCNFVIDGILYSAGMLLTQIQEEFNATSGQVAPVASLLAGFYLLAGPFVSVLSNKYGFRVVTIVGSIISSAAFALSYFATSVEYLYLVYGIVGGIGFCMIYMPGMLSLGFYFERWRALATGLSLCGSGIGTFVFAPITNILIKSVGWRVTIVIHAGSVLLCIIFGAMFRPINPVRVTLADEQEEDTTRRHEEAVEKLNSMLKLHNKLDSGISMPPENRVTNKVSPHTWMGVATNTKYPTAEEIFKGSISNLTGGSSATTSNLKNQNKPFHCIRIPVAENDNQEDSNSNNAEPLITESTKFVSINKSQLSNKDLMARPIHRDVICFGGSVARLPQYTSRTSLGYHLHITHMATQEEKRKEISGKCKLCSKAVKQALAIMLDVSLFRSPTFVILAISGFFTMLGFLVPFMYVTERAELNGIGGSTSSMLLSTIAASNIVGLIVCGLMSSIPKVPTLWLYNITLSAAGLASILSGLSYHVLYQFSYCGVFGMSIACFIPLRPILIVEYIGLEQLTNCYGFFLLFEGLGALLGAPIAGALMDITKSYDIAFYVSGGFLLLSALMCYPVNFISRWEKSRNKLSASIKA